MQTDTVNRRQSDRTRDDVFDLLKAVMTRIKKLNDLFAVFVKNFTLASQPKFLFATFNQQRFKSALQHPDLLTHGRLGDVVDLSRFRKALGLRQVTKHF